MWRPTWTRSPTWTAVGDGARRVLRAGCFFAAFFFAMSSASCVERLAQPAMPGAAGLVLLGRAIARAALVAAPGDREVAGLPATRPPRPRPRGDPQQRHEPDDGEGPDRRDDDGRHRRGLVRLHSCGKRGSTT